MQLWMIASDDGEYGWKHPVGFFSSEDKAWQALIKMKHVWVQSPGWTQYSRFEYEVFGPLALDLDPDNIPLISYRGRLSDGSSYWSNAYAETLTGGW